MFFFFVSPEDVTRWNAWVNLSQVLKSLEEENPLLSIGAVRTLVELRRNQQNVYYNYESIKQLSDSFCIPYTTFTRYLDSLGDGLPGRKGAGLVKKVNIGDNKKAKTVEFTEKGIALLEKIEKIIGGDIADNHSQMLPKTRPAPPLHRRPRSIPMNRSNKRDTASKG